MELTEYVHNKCYHCKYFKRNHRNGFIGRCKYLDERLTTSQNDCLEGESK